MRETTVKQILSQTKGTYSHIAFDFDKKRNWVWKGFENFLQYAKPGSKILDVGCGNGRLLQLLSNSSISYTGFDNNEKLLELAKKNHPKAIFALGEAAQLPFDNNKFDIVFMIAILHHIPSAKLRERVLHEAYRVLRPKGIFIMTNWDRYRWRYSKCLIKYTALKFIGASRLDFKDVMIPWSNSEYERYYHCFTLGEMKRVTQQAGFTVLSQYKIANDERSSADRNIVIIAQK